MMKSILALALMASANAATPAMRTLLKNARRLDDGGNGNDNGNDDVYAFLDDYSIVLKECHDDITLLGDSDYPIYGTVVFRMCPSNSCNPSYNKKGQVGCKTGYADFAVDIGTYVAAMLEEQADNINWDDQVGDLDNYAQCAEYDSENGSVYYVGPSCMDDGRGVKLAVFDEATCQTQSSSSFETISNGWALPYSNGGLVSESCISCYDNDEGGPSELCMDLYDNSAYRCEEDWDVSHYYYDAITEVNKYGRDTTGCVTISRFNYTKPKVNAWEELGFVFILLILTAAGYYYYTKWWDERKYSRL
jgi:hypothetical protein